LIFQSTLLSNTLHRILALVGKDWHLWEDNSRNVQLIAGGGLDDSIGHLCKWSPINPNVFAVSSRGKAFSVKNIAYPDMAVLIELPYAITSISFSKSKEVLLVGTNNGIQVFQC
jgi:hypothetical protein